MLAYTLSVATLLGLALLAGLHTRTGVPYSLSAEKLLFLLVTAAALYFFFSAEEALEWLSGTASRSRRRLRWLFSGMGALCLIGAAHRLGWLPTWLLQWIAGAVLVGTASLVLHSFSKEQQQERLTDREPTVSPPARPKPRRRRSC